jgi:clan AA aspartic protease
MIIGSVNSLLAGTIRCLIQDAAGNRHVVEATVDTAFSGFLTLPRDQINALNLPYLYHNVVVLGDGTSVLMHLYDATLDWDGLLVSADVVESDTNPLVGMSMLAGYRLRIDVVDGGAVEIEKLP